MNTRTFGARLTASVAQPASGCCRQCWMGRGDWARQHSVGSRLARIVPRSTTAALAAARHIVTEDATEVKDGEEGFVPTIEGLKASTGGQTEMRAMVRHDARERRHCRGSGPGSHWCTPHQRHN